MIKYFFLQAKFLKFFFKLKVNKVLDGCCFFSVKCYALQRREMPLTLLTGRKKHMTE